VTRIILEAKAVRRTFGGLVAVNDVDMDVAENSIHAVIGPNGAGKTTFFNTITAVIPAVSGSIRFNGEGIEKLPTHAISRKGIARTFQNIRLFPYMSVLENVKVGTHNLTRSNLADILLRNRKERREEREIEEHCLAFLEKVGLAAKRDTYARNLPYGEQRKLEIARALASNPKLLLLDEPAAGMNNKETDDLETFVRSLRSEGFTIIIIEHDMKFIMSIADRISVLDYGVKIAEGTAAEIQNNDAVIEAYLGKRRAV
jgi:branched-chain amino acid transport system ATP-binding protein